MKNKNIGKPLKFEYYNQRDSEILSVTDGYNKWSKSYNSIEDYFDIDLLNNLVYIKKKIKDHEILDVGCGTGRIGCWLNQYNPSEIIGIDINKKMLKYAEKMNVYKKLIVSDIFNYSFENTLFFGIISSLMLCHISELNRFYKIISDLIEKNGWLCIIDYHPYMLLNGIPTRFEDVTSGKKYSIKNYIHSISDHFNLGKENGLDLIEFKERYVTKNWVQEVVAMQKHEGKAVSFIMVFEKK